MIVLFHTPSFSEKLLIFVLAFPAIISIYLLNRLNGSRFNFSFSVGEWVLFVFDWLLIALSILLVYTNLQRKRRITQLIKEINNISLHGGERLTTSLLSNLTRLTRERYKDNIILSRLQTVKNVELLGIQLSISLDVALFDNCTIKGSKFGNKNLFEFRNVKVNTSSVNNTNFFNGSFNHLYFLESVLRNCIFDKISFTDTQFDHTKLWNVQFTNCVFNNPIRLNIKNQSIESLNLMVTSGFICSRLQDVAFNEVQFNGLDFTGTGLINCRFNNVSGLKAQDFYFVKTLYKTVLSESINQSLRETHPQLFEKPSK